MPPSRDPADRGGRVDQSGRRRELTEVVLTLTAERGLDAVSVREVAAAAGVSIGTVQHHFPTKDDLLLDAMQQVGNRFEVRVRSALETVSGPRAKLDLLLRELLPLDETRRAELRMWLAFAARATVAPALAQLDAHGQALRRDACRQLIERARDSGETRPDVVPEVAAHALNALVDGLAVQMGTDPADVAGARAVAALEATLAALLDPIP